MLKKDRGLNLLKAFLFSLVLSLLLIALVSILLRFTGLKESQIPIINNLIMIVTISISSMILAGKIGEKGWLYGLVLGGIYYLFIIFLNIIFMKISILNPIYIIKLLISIIIGAIGGIIGINLD